MQELKHGWSQMAGRIIISVKEDIHPHVRWAALYTIKQFSRHLKPEFQDKYHEKVMPALTKAMDDVARRKTPPRGVRFLAMAVFSLCYWN